MSGPKPEDFRAKVFRDRERTGDWRIEKLCTDGAQPVVCLRMNCFIRSIAGAA